MVAGTSIRICVDFDVDVGAELATMAGCMRGLTSTSGRGRQEQELLAGQSPSGDVRSARFASVHTIRACGGP